MLAMKVYVGDVGLCWRCRFMLAMKDFQNFSAGIIFFSAGIIFLAQG
jgi:hypothetical protein